jgi:hypothetical protein
MSSGLVKNPYFFNNFVILFLVFLQKRLDVDCQTQGRLKFMIELYVSEKSVINSIDTL